MKKIFLLLGITLFLFSCEQIEEPTSPVLIPFDGGDFYIYPDENNMIFNWGTSGLFIGAVDTVNGEANTQLIVDADSNASAAKYCDELVAYGFDDWYMPSYKEMEAVKKNIDKLPSIVGGMYWTSSEIHLDYARSIFINFSHTYSPIKSNTYKCLCARKD